MTMAISSKLQDIPHASTVQDCPRPNADRGYKAYAPPTVNHPVPTRAYLSVCWRIFRPPLRQIICHRVFLTPLLDPAQGRRHGYPRVLAVQAFRDWSGDGCLSMKTIPAAELTLARS
jgi:hypothetical protein